MARLPHQVQKYWPFFGLMIVVCLACGDLIQHLSWTAFPPGWLTGIFPLLGAYTGLWMLTSENSKSRSAPTDNSQLVWRGIGIALLVLVCAFSISISAALQDPFLVAVPAIGFGLGLTLWLLRHGLGAQSEADTPAVEPIATVLAESELGLQEQSPLHVPQLSSTQPVTPQSVISQTVMKETCEPTSSAVELEFCDELDTATDSELLQLWKRERLSTGEERLSGSMLVKLAEGEQVRHLHIPFSPPFASLPTAWCEADADGIRLEVGPLQTYGARLTLRRSLDSRSAEEFEIALFFVLDADQLTAQPQRSVA